MLHYFQLFDHIAECLASFIKERNLGDELLPLGFTFSFPCKQEGLTKARLARWTKGFKCEGVEGRDVVELLKLAIARRGVSTFCLLKIISTVHGLHNNDNVVEFVFRDNRIRG